MPRTGRHLIGNVFVHNMAQGINREYIFQDENNKRKYKKLMKKYSEKYNVYIIAYCIMDNHVHILTYSQDIKNISSFMKEVNTEYAIYYNKLNQRVGYVFRNRFNSKPILDQRQLLSCIKYIHMNPVKAKKVQSEKDYKYSSYNEYIEKTGFINLEILNLVFGSLNNYLEKFKSIEYNPLNYDKNEIKLNQVINEYLRINQLEIGMLKNNKLEIRKLMVYLTDNEYEFSKCKLAMELKISRSSLYRRLKKDSD